MKKRMLSLLLVLCLCLTALPFSAGARDLAMAQVKAEALKSLGLFQGVSETDFALNRAPTRAEALVMYIRAMGAEAAALSSSYSHPFRDVPAWADKYVGYAYHDGITTGISATEFGSGKAASAATYLTFTLRALGYSEGNGDFSFKDPFTLAKRIGILPSTVDTKNFLRADVVLVAWESLFVPMNGGNKDLCDILAMGGAFSQAQLTAAMKMVEKGPTASSGSGQVVNGVKTGTYVCKVSSMGEAYDAKYQPSITLKADGTCTVTINYGEGMATGNGTWRASFIEDMGFTGVFITMTTTPWNDATGANYTFSLLSNGGLFKEDGGIGITPVESVFEYVG